MARYQIILAYDGTDFCGFQRQGLDRTVQFVVEEALRQIGWQGESILAAGRTDTGVHASGQVIAFDLEWRHGEEVLIRALNAHLPEDVAVKRAKLVDDRFHPRFQARFRCYQYRIYSDAGRDPFLNLTAWRVFPELNLDLLNQAAAMLVGRHDFSAFGTPPQKGGSTTRMIYRAEWQKTEPNLIVFEVMGTAFLYHMVRRMVLLQVQVAQERLALDEFIKTIREQKFLAPGLAPAHGLFLTKVGFTNDVQWTDQSSPAAPFEML